MIATKNNTSVPKLSIKNPRGGPHCGGTEVSVRCRSWRGVSDVDEKCMR